jgi:hypothetical protein
VLQRVAQEQQREPLKGACPRRCGGRSAQRASSVRQAPSSGSRSTSASAVNVAA